MLLTASFIQLAYPSKAAGPLPPLRLSRRENFLQPGETGVCLGSNAVPSAFSSRKTRIVSKNIAEKRSRTAARSGNNVKCRVNFPLFSAPEACFFRHLEFNRPGSTNGRAEIMLPFHFQDDTNKEGDL